MPDIPRYVNMNHDNFEEPIRYLEDQVGDFDVMQQMDGTVHINLRYVLPNGTGRRVSQTVQGGPHVTPALIEVTKQAMERMAEREIDTYVRQNAQAQQGEVGNMPFAYGHSPLWTNEVGWGVNAGWGCDTGIATTATMNPVEGGTNLAGNYYVRYAQTPTNCWHNDVPDLPVAGTADYLNGYAAGQQIGDLANRARKSVLVRFKLGRHTLLINKTIGDDECLEITQEDIDRAKGEHFQRRRVEIIAHKADGKAEDLLRMFISEVDFRDYKDKGFFTIKSGDKAFRIYKDSHKHIDMYEKDKDRGIFVPKNRLCVHTERRVLPQADEALAKLMLVRSGQIIESANLHPIDSSMEKELVLV
ncbi:MAG: hypothetical protein WC208_08445 [Gallionella sp.]|jgi:hypothetical protein